MYGRRRHDTRNEFIKKGSLGLLRFGTYNGSETALPEDGRICKRKLEYLLQQTNVKIICDNIHMALYIIYLQFHCTMAHLFTLTIWVIYDGVE